MQPLPTATASHRARLRSLGLPLARSRRGREAGSASPTPERTQCAVSSNLNSSAWRRCWQRRSTPCHESLQGVRRSPKAAPRPRTPGCPVHAAWRGRVGRARGLAAAVTPIVMPGARAHDSGGNAANRLVGRLRTLETAPRRRRTRRRSTISSRCGSRSAGSGAPTRRGWGAPAIVGRSGHSARMPGGHDHLPGAAQGIDTTAGCGSRAARRRQQKPSDDTALWGP